MNYDIAQKFISINRSGKNLNAKGIVLHETSTPGASDENEQAYFNSGNRGASAHAFVDYDSITQTIPWSEQAWHAGPTANQNYIGIELCNYNDPVKFQEVWKRAIWLFAWLQVNIIKQSTITKDNLMSHAEVSNKWHETDHQDPVAYFAKYGRTVDQFRAEVQDAINIMIGKVISQPQPNTKPSINGDVLKVQQSMNRLGFRGADGNRLTEDGINGNNTINAVKRFQSITGLVVDGVVGANTWGAINSILAKPLLKVGINGIPTKYVQYKVGVSFDGVFGNGTKAAVIAWQRKNGLVADGIVGNNSWNKLIG